MKNGLCKHYLHVAGLLLAFAGLAKVSTIFGEAEYLKLADPLIGIRFRYLLLIAGIAELILACLCVAPRFAKAAPAIVAWLATNFLVYRLGLWWIGWRKPCNCLGNLTDALHISPVVADNVMKGVLAYLLIGSCLVLWSDRKRVKVLVATSGEGAVTSVAQS